MPRTYFAATPSRSMIKGTISTKCTQSALVLERVRIPEPDADGSDTENLDFISPRTATVQELVMKLLKCRTLKKIIKERSIRTPFIVEEHPITSFELPDRTPQIHLPEPNPVLRYLVLPVAAGS